MNPLLFKTVIQPLQKNPTLGTMAITGGLCFLTYWWYASSIRNQLLRTQRECHSISQSALADCREMLKAGEASWAKDVKERDAQVRRLELQNVEQTRSVARLESAMKTCLVQSS